MSDASEGAGVDDLDVEAEEAEDVTGGRLAVGDPCDGGE